jgi:hypothetical protein
MNAKDIASIKAELRDIKTAVAEIKTLLRQHNEYFAQRLRKLNSIDSSLSLMEQQFSDIGRRVKYICEQISKD